MAAVVPSPKPLEIPDMRVLQLLLEQGVVVICAGGGGIPILRRDDGSMIGIEAVIDKDAASALLASQLGADALLLLTDVDAIYRNFGKDTAAPIHELTLDEARKLEPSRRLHGPENSCCGKFLSKVGVSVVLVSWKTRLPF
ncbi:hypothetical protein ULG90_14360 [Halopseudomonas pachastrellae]|nr:hypothetical protein ULG90_14360 [Halopseudomonas pachastrellae]